MAAPNITPINQTNLRDGVYQAIRDAFARGEFAPGDVVSLRKLAEQIGTSMTPVREAVRRLVAAGALIDTRSRTLIVPPFDARRMSDLKSARLALETLALEQAMDHIDDAGIAQLNALLQEPKRTTQTGPNLLQNYEFHFTLYRFSGSEVLLPIIEGLWLQYGAYLNLIINHPAATEIAEHQHHFEIIKALKQNNRTAAKNALTKDIQRSFNVLLKNE